MRPNTGKLLNERVIGVHALPGNKSYNACKAYFITTPYRIEDRTFELKR